MEDIDENEQTPKIFENRMNEPEDESKWSDLIAYKAYRQFINDEAKKKVLDKLARNIKLIKSEYSGSRKKRCRDVNHWINEKIKTLENNKSERDLKDTSYTIFNEIKWNGENKDKVCNRDEEPYPNKDVDLMKELDDYCEIRDNNLCNVLKDKNECSKYNSYVNRKKQYFSDEKNQICDTSDCSKINYTIDANCTLNNMDNTFRKINCDCLYKTEELKKIYDTIKERSPLEIGSIISRFRRIKYDFKRNFEREDDDRYSLYHSEKIPADSENKHYYIEYARPHN
ncbi:unnamed protein product [Plasmodium vivax]|uniref:(malaria parasite P. vivax) hypothetical protein n=1 Tax=Plasmodium vivax TaxID=5855 RepID=A0A8S4HQ65_PLAVI|nr:unnamed protein product [Plasmodium vivax]